MTEEPGPQPGSASHQWPSRPSEAEAASVDYAARAAQGVGKATEQMAAVVERFARAANAQACVGPPYSADGQTVVPLAAVSVAAGFGIGFGGGGGSQDGNAGGGSGGGGGGGGRGSSRVIALARISSDGVRVEPVPDVTTLALAAMALAGLRMLRGRPGEATSRRRLFGLLRRRD